MNYQLHQIEDLILHVRSDPAVRGIVALWYLFSSETEDVMLKLDDAFEAKSLFGTELSQTMILSCEAGDIVTESFLPYAGWKNILPVNARVFIRNPSSL